MTDLNRAFKILCLLLTLVTCSKKDEPMIPTVTPTSLTLTLIDISWDSVSNAVVRLYGSEMDRLNKTNQIGDSLVSDVKGQVTFKNLSLDTYFWNVEKGCINNHCANFNTRGNFIKNQQNFDDVYVLDNGGVIIVNNSSDSYTIFEGGYERMEIFGGGTGYLCNWEFNSYKIRAVQQSGFTSTPVDLSFDVDVVCGNWPIISIP